MKELSENILENQVSLEVSRLYKWAGQLLVVLSICLFARVAFADNDVYRLYNYNTGEHFYTSSQVESVGLQKLGWVYEGIGWVAPSEGKPVYRLYNPNAKGGDHYYTESAFERDSLVQKGWHFDGSFWKSGGTVPVYVAYTNASSGAHHYTTTAYERDSLLKVGWKFPSVAWYAAAPGKLTQVEPPLPVSPLTQVLDKYVGHWLGSHQCYAVPSYYASAIDPQHIPSFGLEIRSALPGHWPIAAADIATDYPWAAWGWQVIVNPSLSQIKSGDIITFKRGAIDDYMGIIGKRSNRAYGHTAVVRQVLGGGRFSRYEQGVTSGGVIITTATYHQSSVAAVIRPNK